MNPKPIREGRISTRSGMSSLRRRRVLQGGLALTTLGLSGCAGAGPSPIPTAASAPPSATGAAGAGAAATPAPTAAKAKYGGIVRSTAVAAGPHDDFQQSPASQSALSPVLAYSRLMTYKSGKDVQPGTYLPIGDLAESWEQPDDLTYIFKLRRGVKFHNLKPVNGRELTAQDILYSYRRGIDLNFLASLLGSIQNMVAPDPYTFKVTLSQPDADFLANLANVGLSIVAQEAIEVNGDLKNGPHIGSGPWVVESVDLSTRNFVLVRNPEYFLKGLPYLDRLEFSRVVEPNTIVSAFRAKQFDLIGNGLSPAQTDPIYKANPNEITVVQYTFYGPSDELGFRTDIPPFNDARIRRAVVLAMDREDLIGGANAGFAILTSGVITPDVSWQLAPEVLKPLYKRDVAGAKRLLAEAGQPSFEFELSVPTYKAQVYVTMGEQLQAQLREAGVNVRLKVLDSATYTSVVSTRGEFSAYLGNANVRLTANQDLLNRYHSKGPIAKIQTRYNNPKLDDLIDQQKVLSRDPAKRRAVLEQVQRTVIEDNILVSVSAPYQQVLRWNYFKDFFLNGNIVDSVGCWTEAWLDK
jgi:peptide/nickel transport system substrate-binding protein